MSNTTIFETRNAPLRKPRRLLRAAIILAALLPTAAGAAWLGASLHDVGATTPHSAPVEWALRSAMEASVRAHARDISIPAGVDLQDPALAERAIGHYSVGCAPCHGAPAHPPAPWMVMYPKPADLTNADVVSRWSDAELYWLVKHGIEDTGMIALGPTHQEQDLWAVSAFVRQLPAMSGERYHRLVTQYQAQRGAPVAHH